jgi:hypothetical protein
MFFLCHVLALSWLSLFLQTAMCAIGQQPGPARDHVLHADRLVYLVCWVSGEAADPRLMHCLHKFRCIQNVG